jgi:hypothetical protein
MTSKIGERIGRIIDLHTTPLLMEAGFHKERRTFRKVAGDQTQIINFQSHSYANYGARGRFLVNLGVFFPSMFDRWGDGELKSQPKANKCSISKRLATMIPDRKDHWWMLDENSDDDAIAAEIADAVRDYGLPWLEMCSDPSGARAYLESQAQDILSKRYVFGVEMLLKFDIVYFGEDKARATLNRLIESNSRDWLFKLLNLNGWLFSRPTTKEIRAYLIKTGRDLGLL